MKINMTYSLNKFKLEWDETETTTYVDSYDKYKIIIYPIDKVKVSIWDKSQIEQLHVIKIIEDEIVIFEDKILFFKYCNKSKSIGIWSPYLDSTEFKYGIWSTIRYIIHNVSPNTFDFRI